MHKVFVYGTLKEGFPNFSSNNGERLSGEFETVEKYPFYLVGERFSPWFIIDPGKGGIIKGQVFEVTNTALAEMDRLERIDEQDGYKRLVISVKCKATCTHFKTFVYAKPKSLVIQDDIQYQIEGGYTLEHARLYSKRDK